MTPPLILALDGSTTVCGAALLTREAAAQGAGGQAGSGWCVVAERIEADNRGQAKLLLGMVDDMLRESGLEPGDLRGIVVGVGPGTFTGVRIAVATARALALALPVPVTGISTLAALASRGAAEPAVYGERVGAGVSPGPRRLVPVVDARRKQVFYGVYERRDHSECWARSAPFAVCDPADLAHVLADDDPARGGTMVISEDAGLVGEMPAGIDVMVQTVDPARLVLGQQALREPGEGHEGHRLDEWLAGIVAGTALGAPESVKPIYVRSPDADLHITKMKDPWSDAPVPPTRKSDG